MHNVSLYLHSHWPTMLWYVAAWVAIATTISQVWPKPTPPPKWKVVAHLLLVDWPASIKTEGGKAVIPGLGVTLPFALPFLTVSDVAKGPPAVPADAGKVA
jgi:hypothetical protein